MINSQELIKYTKELSILFVEDHDELRMNTSEILKNIFKDVQSANDGKDGLEKYNKYYHTNQKYFDIVLSDIQMPMMNGIELTQNIYNINESQIVIILSAYDDSKYLLPLVNLGIEQFIKKPIDYQELLKSLLNAAKKTTMPTGSINKNSLAKIYLDKQHIYNRDNKSLLKNGEDVYLTKYEIILLQMLTSNVGAIFSNEDIVNNYNTQNENIDSQNIRKLVSKLRKKLPQDCLESIYGIGYKLFTH